MVRSGTESGQGLGILGGTFDPVHFGHLRPALDVLQQLNLSQIRLVPNARPPHRDMPQATTAQRLAMLEVAVAAVPQLQVDDRECRRNTPSYMVDTLKSFRNEFPDRPLYLLVGTDAFAALQTWHQWEHLLDYAHIVVMTRPDASPLPAVMQQWLTQYRATGTDQQALSGRIWPVPVTQLSISATMIREKLAQHQSVHYFLPEKVIGFIKQAGLYQAHTHG